jgi:hypothetical protein
VDSPELAKLRRFALTVALVLITLVVAQVQIKTPLEIAPLGIPLIIRRPNLLTVALGIASVYATLRFIYYGMLAQPSPMRARRELPDRRKPAYVGGPQEMGKFQEEIQQQVARYFPSSGKHKVTFGVQIGADGYRVINMHIPVAVRAMSRADTVDFLLPIIANTAALGLWLYGGLTMPVGTGIFLGLLCLAAVLLYTQTKNSGRWRTAATWLGWIGGVLAAAGLAWLGYSYVRGYIESQPRAPVQYADVSLGDSKEQVLYEKGGPTVLLEDDPSAPAGLRTVVDPKGLPNGKRITDYHHWYYGSAGAGGVEVDFSSEAQRVVRVTCYANQYECPSLLHVTAGMTEDQVLKTLGEPSQSELSTSPIAPLSPAKVLSYSKLGVAFSLEQRRVYALEMGAKPRSSTRAPTVGPKAACSIPPPECAQAKTAKECGEILSRAGRNYFEAYGYEGCEPKYPNDPHP